ncbi:MAG: hypothetical protein QXU18_09825 [Thermoplasmatales archaeon]
MCGLRLGYTPDPDPAYLRITAHKGHLLEMAYKQSRRDRGARIVAEQLLVQVQVPGVRAMITGHIDGIEITDRPYLLEVKTMSEKQYGRWLMYNLSGFPNYLSQITVYSSKISLPIKYVVILRKNADEMIKNETYSVSILSKQKVATLGDGMEAIFKKIQKIESYAKRKKLVNCDSDYPYCKLSYLCQKGDSYSV